MHNPTALTELLNTDTCGQDHVHNLKRMVAAAPHTCRHGCEDYHATISYYRLTSTSTWGHDLQSGQLRAFISRRIAEPRFTSEPLEILIAGAADTSTLATCANWVAQHDASLLDRTIFSILDRCQTPLLACSDFAQRYGLRTKIGPDDLAAPQRAYSADAILLHSVMNFIPPQDRAAVIQRAVDWLKPGGELFVWNALKRDDIRTETAVRRHESGEVHRVFDERHIVLAEDVAVFAERLERRKPHGHSNPDFDHFRELFAQLGLDPVVCDIVIELQPLPDGRALSRPYLRAIIKTGD